MKSNSDYLGLIQPTCINLHLVLPPQVMVLNVSNLLKTVKAVEDEHTRGTRAMESTVEAISQEIRTMGSPLAHNAPPMGPEELIRVTKNVTTATAKAVAAGASNLQSDIVAAANLGRRAISDMLMVSKTVAYTCAETAELRQRTLDAGVAIAVSYRDLLEGVLKGCSGDERMHLSRRVAKCVTDLVAMAHLLKGSNYEDPEDPTVIAENELLGAAASIDAAAKKLANLRPRRNDVKVREDFYLLAICRFVDDFDGYGGLKSTPFGPLNGRRFKKFGKILLRM